MDWRVIKIRFFTIRLLKSLKKGLVRSKLKEWHVDTANSGGFQGSFYISVLKSLKNGLIQIERMACNANFIRVSVKLCRD
jgi:hypothetical protein